MFSHSKTSTFTTEYLDSVSSAIDHIKNANAVLIGVGSGLSAAAGLDYTDPKLAQKWYPEYFSLGLRSISEIMANYWVNTVNRNTERYWGFWAKHINHIRYEPHALKPYQDLFSLVSDKEHFVCTTNVDGQLVKAGFKKENIFAAQGDYALFQCQKPCSHEVYDNRHMIQNMLLDMPSPLEIRKENIPYCPKCGANLIPNLRCDFKFVENPHVQNMPDYQAFVDKCHNKKLVLLELGVGFNTPTIIRYPFEQIAKALPKARLIRVNKQDLDAAIDFPERYVFIEHDLEVVLADLLEPCKY